MNFHGTIIIIYLEKKEEDAPSDKAPSSYPSPSTSPLTIEKPITDTILHPSKSTICKSVFNPSARASHFYNIVEDLAEEACTTSNLEVLQNCPTQ